MVVFCKLKCVSCIVSTSYGSHERADGSKRGTEPKDHNRAESDPLLVFHPSDANLDLVARHLRPVALIRRSFPNHPTPLHLIHVECWRVSAIARSSE